MSDAWQTQTSSPIQARLVPLDEAVGLTLAHDITEIVAGQKKGPAFKKGQVIKEEDLPHLARLGKRNLYVLELGPDDLHEDQAAEILSKALCGPGVEPKGPPSEGKIVFLAAHDGLFELEVQRLVEFNLVPEVMLSTIHRHSPVKKGQELAGTRAIPLVIKRELVERAAEVASRGGPLLRVLPFRPLKAGIVVTGNEVYDGIIEDRFAGIVEKKLTALGSSVVGSRVCPDDRRAVAQAIRELLELGAELIITTAGMSVDPDDVTRHGIAEAGGHDLIYGSPVLPGAMFLVGNLDAPAGEVPILGVPACALFFKTTVLDVVLPRILAGERFTREKIAALAHGGYCQNCPGGCRFPLCGFGRGS